MAKTAEVKLANWKKQMKEEMCLSSLKCAAEHVISVLETANPCDQAILLNRLNMETNAMMSIKVSKETEILKKE